GDCDTELPDGVGNEVGRLRVDDAAETGEDRDQRAAEREPDQVVDRRALRVAEPVGQRPVVAGDTEEPEPDDEESGDGARAERDVERRPEPMTRRLGGAD